MGSNDYALIERKKHLPDLLAMLGLAFDQLNTMAWVIDTEGKIVYANREALRQVGTTLDEIEGELFERSPWRSATEDGKQITREMIARGLRGESSVVEDFILGAEGNPVPVLFSISPLYDPSGKIVALIPEGKIISDLKGIELELKKERLETQMWIDSMAAMVIKSDPYGRIISCNRAFLKAANLNMEQVRGRFICDISHFGKQRKGRNLLRDSIRNAKDGRGCGIEIYLSFSQEVSGTYFVNINPIKDDSGTVVLLVMEIMDISEQVKLRELMLAKEQEYSARLEREVNRIRELLKRTEQFNKSVIDSVPMGIIYLDADNRALSVNPKMQYYLEGAGVDKKCVIGKTLTELGMYPANALWEEAPEDYQSEAVFGQSRMILRNDTGKKFFFEVLSSAIKSPDRHIKGRVLTFNDVTEKVRLESELLSTRIQAEKINSMSLLISGVAHEINNPLTSVLGCAEYLTQDAQLDGELREVSRIIVEEAARARDIIRNLLAVTQNSPRSESSCDLNSIIRSIVGIRINELKTMGIRVIMELEPDIPQIGIDETLMKQVVVNFIQNAADAIVQSGTGDRISFRTMREDEWVVMEVNDNGPGIKEEHQSRIFDPFFTTKPPGKGTGLGLSITYSIIQRHGGSVWLDTATVEGARFLARLPTAHSSNFPDISCHELAWIPSRVLVVDDEKNLCLILSKYLESLGCEVDVASNGLQAMEKIENKAYDAMLVDVRMPSMDGIELYQKIRAKYPEMLSRFAFMSGVSELDITAASMAAAVPVIQKPFSRKDILRFLSTLGQ